MHPRAEQARAAGRLDALQRALEGKEAEMARLAGGEGRVTALKAHFDAALAQLAEERNALQRERGQLVQARPHPPPPCSYGHEALRSLLRPTERAHMWGHCMLVRICRTHAVPVRDGQVASMRSERRMGVLTGGVHWGVQRIASLLEASEEDRLRLQHHYRERLAATDAKMKEVPPHDVITIIIIIFVFVSAMYA